jgi:hypothetical protein
LSRRRPSVTRTYTRWERDPAPTESPPPLDAPATYTPVTLNHPALPPTRLDESLNLDTNCQPEISLFPSTATTPEIPHSHQTHFPKRRSLGLARVASGWTPAVAPSPPPPTDHVDSIDSSQVRPVHILSVTKLHFFVEISRGLHVAFENPRYATLARACHCPTD